MQYRQAALPWPVGKPTAGNTCTKDLAAVFALNKLF
jgi:hypothetical protein